MSRDLTVTVPRLDGGFNVKDSPANIEINESPDCLNVTFDDRGAVKTRLGCGIVNTQAIASAVMDGVASYNGSMIAWSNGSMYRLSNTTFVTIASAQGQFTAGQKVAWSVYQGQLIHSDGTNGPYRYQGPSDFYRLGLATPSAPTAVSNVATASGGGPEAGTYYYKVAYVNTAVVEGEVGSSAAAVTIASTAVIYASGIPTPAASLGIGSRYVYRASGASGPFRRVGTVAGITASTFTDTMGATTWAVQVTPNDDASSLPAFSTIKLHSDHLWVPDADDSGDKSLLRYSDYRTPYISRAENFIPLNEGEDADIVAIGVQDDFVTAFKTNSIWVVQLTSPGDPTTYSWVKSPSNIGIVGSRALVETDNGIVFVGKRNNVITGIHLLAGTRVYQTSDSKLRTDSIGERLESEILALPIASWDDICIGSFNNAIFMSVTKSGDAQNAHGYWFDINRLGAEGQPGSWAPWDGRPTQVSCYVVHTDGKFYAGSAKADGYLIEVNKADTYNDAGSAINSYWWSKQLGGEKDLDSWFKDWRRCNVWFAQLGAYNMKVNFRRDGDSGDGSPFYVSLNPGGSVFDSAIFDSATFGGSSDDEQQIILGQMMSRRLSARFSNENTVNQAFRVYRFNLLSTIRRVY